jgi:signal transduction histidine kinase
MDPFTPRYKFPISLRLNETSIPIRRFDKILFEAPHAKVLAEFTVEDDKPRLIGKVDYILRNREKTILLDLHDLYAITNITDRLPSILKSLGTFKVEFYWFNRRVLEEIEGIGTKRQVQNLVNSWSGGLMVFRDGFRVNPYGNADDDWLDLDGKALASGGYKVNRKQIIGKVDISSLENDALVDQTNREGLRDCDEKKVLIKILKHILEAEFRTFLNKVDEEVQPQIPVTFEDLEDRVGNEEKRIRLSLKILRQKYPEVKKDKEIFSSVEDAIEKIRHLMAEAQKLADSFESGQTKLLNLAGLGLMVEIVAHELNRATRHTLKILADTGELTLDEDVESIFETLESQLKTLQKRLRILDPMSTAGRQVKEKFDLVAWIKEILSSHEAQFWRHSIKYSVKVKPSRASKGFPVKMVKGMIVQVMENLLSNSVYWLKQQRTIEKGFSPEIVVTIDTQEKEIQFTDNGPGVPPFRKEEIFQPFVTTKPPGEGKGLGLFISREIVKYHEASIYMSEEKAVH